MSARNIAQLSYIISLVFHIIFIYRVDAVSKSKLYKYRRSAVENIIRINWCRKRRVIFRRKSLFCACDCARKRNIRSKGRQHWVASYADANRLLSRDRNGGTKLFNGSAVLTESGRSLKFARNPYLTCFTGEKRKYQRIAHARTSGNI